MEIENFKKQEELSQEQTLKLRPIRLNHPEVVFTNTELSKTISKFGEVSCGSCNFSCFSCASSNDFSFFPLSDMTNKKLAFFGDTNKVMLYDLENECWTIDVLKGIHDFHYYAAAITLPNGDAQIIGGGSSTAVYQYTINGELLPRKPMHQMRKEHSAVINDSIVYVMGGYDGV